MLTFIENYPEDLPPVSQDILFGVLYHGPPDLLRLHDENHSVHFTADREPLRRGRGWRRIDQDQVESLLELLPKRIDPRVAKNLRNGRRKLSDCPQEQISPSDLIKSLFHRDSILRHFVPSTLWLDVKKQVLGWVASIGIQQENPFIEPFSRDPPEFPHNRGSPLPFLRTYELDDPWRGIWQDRVEVLIEVYHLLLHP